MGVSIVFVGFTPVKKQCGTEWTVKSVDPAWKREQLSPAGVADTQYMAMVLCPFIYPDGLVRDCARFQIYSSSGIDVSRKGDPCIQSVFKPVRFRGDVFFFILLRHRLLLRQAFCTNSRRFPFLAHHRSFPERDRTALSYPNRANDKA